MTAYPLYGLLKFSSMNIGDEIQSVAAQRFLPHVDRLIHRERTDEYRANRKTKVILNAWWLWNEEHFPPSSDIDPLLISMYFRKEVRDTILRPDVREWLAANGPVGARDMSTMRWLHDSGVDAYFSGCLTLTLQGNPGRPRRDYILTVDLPEIAVRAIRERTGRPVYSISRILSAGFAAADRIELARIALQLYTSAHAVVSPCLHVTLPCLAMGTPVLRIDDGDGAMDAHGRFEGFTEMLNSRTLEEFLADPRTYDFENPPANPTAHLPMREDLIRRCTEFTGFDRTTSPLDSGTDPLVELFQLLKYDYRVVRRNLWWARPRDLRNTYLARLRGETKHSVAY